MNHLIWLNIFFYVISVEMVGFTKNIGNPECAIDLGIAVDDSSSVQQDEFLKMKELIYRIIENIGPSRNGAHVSTMFYSYDARILFHFKDEAGHNRFSARSTISSYQPKGGKTCTENALITARSEMFKQDQIRTGVSQVLLLIGDGGSNCNWDHLYRTARDLKRNGVTIITVGIGYDVNFADLKVIATSSEHVFEFASIDGAIGTIDRILKASCRTQLKINRQPYIAPVYSYDYPVAPPKYRQRYNQLPPKYSQPSSRYAQQSRNDQLPSRYRESNREYSRSQFRPKMSLIRHYEPNYLPSRRYVGLASSSSPSMFVSPSDNYVQSLIPIDQSLIKYVQPYKCLEDQNILQLFRTNLIYEYNPTRTQILKVATPLVDINGILRKCSLEAKSHGFNIFAVSMNGNCYGNSIDSINNSVFVTSDHCTKPDIVHSRCTSENEYCLGGPRSLFVYKLV